MDDLISRIFFKPYRVNYPIDVILQDVPNSVIETAYKYKLIQQRIGIAWGEVPTIYGWRIGDNGIDLVNETTKQAAEVKNNSRTDNSRSRRANFDNLLQFKTLNPEYELLYIIINDKTDKDVMKYNGRIRYVSGIHAQRILFGEDSQNVINKLKQYTIQFLNRSDLINTECDSN